MRRLSRTRSRVVATVIAATSLVVGSSRELPALEPPNIPASGTIDCKEFPVRVYPTTTSSSCEKSDTGRYTAYIESADSMQQLAAYYRTQVQAGGWTVKPDDEKPPPDRISIVIEKGKGYASIHIRPGMNGKGSSAQIHAYPLGNQ